MTAIDRMHICGQLDRVSAACQEIKKVLIEQLEKTGSVQYKADIEKDMVTLENLNLIILAVKEDIEKNKSGACTELLLRIAANDFKNKVALIPEKKALRNEIIKSLKEIHSYVLSRTIRNNLS